MHTTSLSLLRRLRQPVPDAQAWDRFVQLYTPLLYQWARRAGLQEEDAADLVQDVFTVLLQKLPEFHYDSRRGFRAWLRTVTLNKWRETLRRRSPPINNHLPDEVADPATEDPVQSFWEEDYRQHLFQRALQILQADFAPSTWKAFWEVVICERTAPQVAQELNMTVGAVYAAKVRVLSRLREELEELLE
ncbi:MAG: RNA polymerase sigma factor [Gemmataceae bacterium]